MGQIKKNIDGKTMYVGGDRAREGGWHKIRENERGKERRKEKKRKYSVTFEMRHIGETL